ncbi:MAG: flagellar motor protein MotB [Rhodoferax sp.]|nr:flagellar motor protein MotB [Rhodoferax sp.]
MATDAKKLQPIIIKKVKKGGHAVHGGAWKIAYADFVTAMMAFFLLMWLLGSTSEGDKKGLSDYFSSPLKVSMQGGSGAGASNSILTGGGADLTQQSGQSKKGDGSDPLKKKTKAVEAMRAEVAKQDAKTMAKLAAKISEAISNNAKLTEFSSQIRIESTPDGLQIQIIDDQRRPMFDSGSAQVKPYMRDILRELGTALGDIDNKISLDGHTDSAPYSSGQRGYSNWELSADRANASRRELVAAGMPEDKLARVVGLASSVLFDQDNPLSPSNRRISIIVMTREAEERLLGKSRQPPPKSGEPSKATPSSNPQGKP